VHVNSSLHPTRDHEQIAREILNRPTPSTLRRTSGSVRRAAMSCRPEL
jgi:hypothetical protein